VAGEEREAERKVRARKDSQGLDEDVCDGLIAGEVRVELVSVMLWSAEARESRRVQQLQCKSFR
jgi:hypothetical protein